MEYVQRKGEDDDDLGCDSCKVDDVPTCMFKKDFPLPERQYYLCDLCASTFIGNAYSYPDHHSLVTPQMLAQAIHWLKKELKK